MTEVPNPVHVFRTGGVTSIILYATVGFAAVCGVVGVAANGARALGLWPRGSVVVLITVIAISLLVAVVSIRFLLVYRRRGYETLGSILFRRYGLLREHTAPVADLLQIEAATAVVRGSAQASTIMLVLHPRPGAPDVDHDLELSGLSHGTQRKLHSLLSDHGVQIRNDWTLGFGKKIPAPRSELN